MPPKSRKNITIATTLAIAATIGLFLVARSGDNINLMVTNIVGIALIALFIWACTSIAVEKGYHWSLGLLGFFHVIGLIVLAVFPSKEPKD